jgi:drug/metabolite transporter (DMT)-like permease
VGDVRSPESQTENRRGGRTRLGPLGVAAILGALYAIPTVVLAAIFLRERMLPRHWVGLGLAGLATALVAI